MNKAFIIFILNVYEEPLDSRWDPSTSLRMTIFLSFQQNEVTKKPTATNPATA